MKKVQSDFSCRKRSNNLQFVRPAPRGELSYALQLSQLICQKQLFFFTCHCYTAASLAFCITVLVCIQRHRCSKFFKFLHHHVWDDVNQTMRKRTSEDNRNPDNCLTTASFKITCLKTRFSTSNRHRPMRFSSLSWCDSVFGVRA